VDMPDVTMCDGLIHGPGRALFRCPFRDRCYRFTAEPDPFWQSYFAHAPFVDEGCEYFMDNGGRGGERPPKREGS